MKKFLLFVLSLFLLGSIASAQSLSVNPYNIETKKVAFILDIPVEYINNEEIRDMVMDKVNRSFKAPRFEVLPFEETQLAKIDYCEAHGIPTFSNSGSMSPYLPDTTNETTLRIYDLQNIGKDLQADYVFYVSLSTSRVITSKGWLDSSTSATGRCEAKVVDTSTGKYVYQEVFTAEGESTTFLAENISSKKALMYAIENCMSKVHIDTSKF